MAPRRRRCRRRCRRARPTQQMDRVKHLRDRTGAVGPTEAALGPRRHGSNSARGVPTVHDRLHVRGGTCFRARGGGVFVDV
eukprot:1775500-Lingulodinium_polyedra.AAC.1